MNSLLSRRGFLLRSGALGCSLAASPLVTPVSYAAAPWDHRLVVIILRGGLDGLDALRPWGEPGFAALRPGLVQTRDPVLDLDGFWGLHPALAPLLPLWQKGELGFVNATSTPYRDKRSHFDGQDLLEAGTVSLDGGAARDGWLNRMLQGMDGVEAHTAYSVGREAMLLTTGAAPVSNWSPDVDLALSSQGLSLLELVLEEDPAMASAMSRAVDLAGRDGDAVVFDAADEGEMMGEIAQDVRASRKGRAHLKIASFAAEQLRGDARVVSFSLGGWDTHKNQQRALNRPLENLGQTILQMRDEMGADVWGKTTVLAMTEFGRTVRENGTSGTDHGTGGLMIAAGGALRGGQVFGRWPGLDEAALYDRRDLMPTSDVRAWVAWAMRGSFGLDRRGLESRVFPGLDMGDNPGLLL